MERLPKDPFMLVSSINMLLRDGEFDSLEELCHSFDREPEEVKAELLQHGYVYSEEQKQMRPAGYNDRTNGMITKDSIETAYSFFHQKERIYVHSTLDWQRDDIECAIESYVDDMSPELYRLIAEGRKDFLRDHKQFQKDIMYAVDMLEKML